MPKSKKSKKKMKPATGRSKVKTKSAKRPSLRQSTRKAALQYIPWHTIPLERLNPLLQRQFVVGQEIMLARVLLDKGCIVPLHSHVNEQLTYIVEGALKFYIDGKEIVVRAGEVLCIPSNMPHKALALEVMVNLDVLTSPRADYSMKTDALLLR